MSRMSLYDFRDMDVMLKLQGVGATGATAAEMADEMGLGGDTRARNAVGTRMAWMRRFGMTAFDPKKKLWTLSPGGERVLAAKRRAALKSLVDEMPEGELIEAMAYITSRYRSGDPMTAAMLRREFIYGTSPRSSIWRMP